MLTKNKNLEEYQKAGQELYDKLHFQSYPVGIKYIKHEEEIPPEAIQPSKRDKRMSICQAFYMSRRFGNIYAITAADNFCTPSTVAHGWINISEAEFIESQVRQGWHKDEKAERRRAKKLYLKNFKNIIGLDYHGLISFPLHKAPLVPNTVLIFGNGAQITHIIHSLCFEHKKKYSISSNFEGFGESCGKGGLMPFITRKAQIIIPGSGDRAFAGIQDQEIGIGIPAEHIFYVLQNLFKTGGQQGLGFPIKSMIPLNLTENITPGFKFMKDIIDKKLKQEETHSI
ncbi:MAG: hypothetical protein GF317_20155 [Candidatus Lokiarchaeota archaeon]|nr:hypothetical protein [Candidatus Lokiarchaeota archaeon]MBD3201796.1 hypothetical protein [Candidatus Lokiarchaeota archaeon]